MMDRILSWFKTNKVETRSFCASDLPKDAEQMHLLMAEIASAISQGLTLLDSEITVRFVSIKHSTDNPDGTQGFFRIIERKALKK